MYIKIAPIIIVVNNIPTDTTNTVSIGKKRLPISKGSTPDKKTNKKQKIGLISFFLKTAFCWYILLQDGQVIVPFVEVQKVLKPICKTTKKSVFLFSFMSRTFFDKAQAFLNSFLFIKYI